MKFLSHYDCAAGHGLLRCLSYLLPSHQRCEWLSEWSAELSYVSRVGGHQTEGNRFGKYAPWQFCLGACHDVFWLSLRGNLRASERLRSPSSCLAFLLSLTFASLFVACLKVGFEHVPFPAIFQEWIDQSPLCFLIEVLAAACSLPAITSLSLGDYPQQDGHDMSRNIWSPWLFLLAKTTLVLVIAYCAPLGFKHMIESFAMVFDRPSLYVWFMNALFPIQPLACFAGCLFGMRWVLNDQRKRCPVCLRRLGKSVNVGDPSRSFLAWGGLELLCFSGHGLLHVPEAPTSWFETQRWQHLDASWRVLFVAAKS